MGNYLKFLLLPASALAASPGAELGDPTRPPVLPVTAQAPTLRSQQAEWVLTMVKSSASYSAAVLNGRVVHEGDVVGSATVAEIRPSAVVMQHGDATFEVTLGGTSGNAAVTINRRPVEPAQNTEVKK